MRTRRRDPIDGSMKCPVHGQTAAVYMSPNEKRKYLICRACRAEHSRRWWEKNKARHNLTMKLLHDRLKLQVIREYGGCCECCGEDHLEFLTIDHISGDGKTHRRQLGGYGGIAVYRWLRKKGFPKDNFRLLCLNCNWARGNRGYCPHEASVNVLSAC